jgi:hypothetical protein
METLHMSRKERSICFIAGKSWCGGNGRSGRSARLSRWRHGGCAGWLENQLSREAVLFTSAAGRTIDQEDREALTSQLALSVSVRMVAELRKYDELPDGPLKADAWQKLVWSLTLLRRGEFYAGKLKLEQDKLPPRKETGQETLNDQQMRERSRLIMGQRGPHWNNFTPQ